MSLPFSAHPGHEHGPQPSPARHTPAAAASVHFPAGLGRPSVTAAASVPPITGGSAARGRRRLAALITLAALAGCGGSGDSTDTHAHTQTRIDTLGRLAITEQDVAAVHIFDLDTRQIEARHSLAAPASALYASPGKRYAVAVQRTGDRVQFIDGGIWQEDHGDHAHDYRQGSAVLSWQIDAAAPTHYDPMGNGQVSIFMDGRLDATPAQNAGVQLLSEQSIAQGRTIARLALSTPMHGLAQSFDDLMLVSARSTPAVANDTLPDHLQLYRRSGESYQLAATLSSSCPRMHGGTSSGDYTLVGCEGGGLLLKREGDSFTETPITTANRMATVLSHAAVPHQFIGLGNSTAPATTHFFAVDASTATATALQPEGWAAGTTRRAHGFDRQGRLLILDNHGTLYTLQFSQGRWTTIKRTENFIELPDAAPWPTLAASGAEDRVYMTDPRQRQLLRVDSQTHQVEHREQLDFSPAGLSWLGITR